MMAFDLGKLNVRIHNLRIWQAAIMKLCLNSIAIDRLIEAYHNLTTIIVSPMSIISLKKMENYNAEIHVLEQQI